jgi:asparagine synthase (glutamine-hydrolysing)
MSGIAGVFNLDGRPVDPALLRRMTDIIAHRGPDGDGHWIDGPVGLGHRMLHTTPESLQEKQPFPDETGHLYLTFDGRVDNRDELRAALEAKDANLRTDTDAELVLQAYKCWGEECLKRIIGDFAFAIWDGRNQQLFCARDPLGIKPLYYYTDGRTFLWGSELRQLFGDPAVGREPNEGMISEYLACAVTSQEETLYRGILRLPPAHMLIIQPGRLRKEQYWDLDPAREVRCRTDEEYAEHFLQIFKEAVRCRLRSHRAVGAELSGGLDSSSIVGMAQSIYHEGALADSGFETFSLVFPGLPCDESAYIQDVVGMWGLTSNAVCPDESDPSHYSEEVRRYHDFPNYPNGSMMEPLSALAHEKGCRVILTGSGGDEWLVGSLYHYADLLRQFRILSLIRQFRFDAHVRSVTSPSLRFLKFGLWPLLRPAFPRSARRAIRWVLRQDELPPWMNHQFAARLQLTERLRRESVGRQFSRFAQGDLYRAATDGWHSHSAELRDRSTSRFSLEQRHPFYDRRVVEFALALPDEQRWRRDQTKVILRQSMRGFLPERVRERLGKAEFSHVFVRALQAQGGERLFASLAIASLGWVDGKQVLRMYRHMAQLYSWGDGGYITYVLPLWMIFGIELWIKAIFLNKEVLTAEETSQSQGQHTGG